MGSQKEIVFITSLGDWMITFLDLNLEIFSLRALESIIALYLTFLNVFSFNCIFYVYNVNKIPLLIF